MIEDIKLSVIEAARIKLPEIPDEHFHKDPPTGRYDRECLYLSFKEKARSKKQYFGSVSYDYFFEVVVENKESDKAALLRTNNIDELFYEWENIPYYHFDNGRKYPRNGYLVVKKFRAIENAKDREKNRIRAELVITF